MIPDPLAVPLLNGKIPQHLVIHPAKPVPTAADQNPVSRGLGVLILEAQLTEPSKRLIRFQNAKVTTGGVSNGEILQDLLKHQHLGLTAVRPKTEPADEHQQQTVESAALEHQQSPQDDHQGGQSPA